MNTIGSLPHRERGGMRGLSIVLKPLTPTLSANGERERTESVAPSSILFVKLLKPSSSAIHCVTDRGLGDQPRSAAALPRMRLFEPSENTAMLRPQAAIASSADHDCAAPRPSRAAIAR